MWGKGKRGDGRWQLRPDELSTRTSPCTIRGQLTSADSYRQPGKQKRARCGPETRAQGQQLTTTTSRPWFITSAASPRATDSVGGHSQPQQLTPGAQASALGDSESPSTPSWRPVTFHAAQATGRVAEQLQVVQADSDRAGKSSGPSRCPKVSSLHSESLVSVDSKAPK